MGWGRKGTRFDGDKHYDSCNRNSTGLYLRCSKKPKQKTKRVKSAVYNVTVREGGGAAAAQSVSMKTPANQRTTKNVLR